MWQGYRLSYRCQSICLFETFGCNLATNEAMTNQRDQVLAIKAGLARLYRSRCAICHCKKSKSGFTFHHLYYLPAEKTYKDFANTLSYYQYLEPIILAQPDRFLYLCSDHHQALERCCRYGDKTWRKLNRYRTLTLRSRRAN